MRRFRVTVWTTDVNGDINKQFNDGSALSEGHFKQTIIDHYEMNHMIEKVEFGPVSHIKEEYCEACGAQI